LNSKPEIAVIRTSSLETLLVNPYELRKILDERVNDLRILQNIIPCENLINHQKNEEEKKFLGDGWKGSTKRTQKNMETIYCKYIRNFGFGNFIVFRKTIKVIFGYIFFFLKLISLNLE